MAVAFRTVTGPDGQTYQINQTTNQVINSAGQVVVGASYNPDNGTLAIPGYAPIDTAPRKGAPTPGETYQRAFTDPTKFFSAIRDGGSYFINRKTGRVYTPSGQYVGIYEDGEFSLFDVPKPAATTTDKPGLTAEQQKSQTALIDSLTGILGVHFTEAAVNEFIEIIKQGINNGLSESEVWRKVRETQTYREFFPEYEQRIKNGFSAWSEGEILSFRDQARNLVRSSYGVDIEPQSVSSLIANNVSINEFSHRLDVFKRMEGTGAAVKAHFSRRLGVDLDDDKLYELFDPEIDTSELNQAYEDSYYQAYVNDLGVKQTVTDDMVKQLRSRGISVEQAIQNYNRLAQALPSLDRLATLDDVVKADEENPFNTFREAFEAYQLESPEAQAHIALMFARETARFRQGGGAAGQGFALQGLLGLNER